MPASGEQSEIGPKNEEKSMSPASSARIKKSQKEKNTRAKFP
jgi:hypothetical protein